MLDNGSHKGTMKLWCSLQQTSQAKKIKLSPSQVSQGLESSETGGETQSWSHDHSPFPIKCPCRLAVLQSSTNPLLHSDTNVRWLLELCLSVGLQTALQSQWGDFVHSCLFFFLLSALLWVGKFWRSSEGVELPILYNSGSSTVFSSSQISANSSSVDVRMHSKQGWLPLICEYRNYPKRCGCDYIKRVLTSCKNVLLWSHWH